MLVLCDGMGGHKAGEVASQFVTNELQKRFEEETLSKSIKLNHGCVQTLKISIFNCITTLKSILHIMAWEQR